MQLKLVNNRLSYLLEGKGFLPNQQWISCIFLSILFLIFNSVSVLKTSLTFVKYEFTSKKFLKIYGFRKNRSTEDVVIILESDMQETFKEKEHLLQVSVDLQKPYDTCWRYNISQTLSDWRIKGHILHFVMNFMKNRKFRVAVGAEMFNIRNIENGEWRSVKCHALPDLHEPDK
jgi:hypothetical protein